MKAGDRVRVNKKYGVHVGKEGVVLGTSINVAKHKEIGYESLPVVTVRLLDTRPGLLIELQATADKFDMIDK
jgi:hypothetical protein